MIVVSQVNPNVIRIHRQEDMHCYVALRGYGANNKSLMCTVDGVSFDRAVPIGEYTTLSIAEPDTVPSFIDISVNGVAVPETNVVMRMESNTANYTTVSREFAYCIIGNNTVGTPSTQAVHILIVMENNGGGS
ncbi:MAG: hypothetical protein AB7H80_11025 [Candidatus Kapaibacterium sp.]